MGLKYGKRPTLGIQACIGWDHDDEGHSYANVTIEDGLSHTVILQFTLDPIQLASFLSGSNANAEAAFTAHPDRIGKLMEHEYKTVPGGAFKDQDDANRAVKQWGVQEGHDTVEARRNNVGRWVFVGRRWVDPSTKES